MAHTDSNVDDITYLYANPEVTKAFEEMDKEEDGKRFHSNV